MSTITYRINREIRADKVRLIDHTGKNLGVVSIGNALETANNADLDLVEVAPNSQPPVCKVMDFGKFVYQTTKKEKEARKAQTKIDIKEIRLRPKTNEHHRNLKVRNARRWLESGKKVKVRIHFRGREITYPELALEDMKEVAFELSDISLVEQKPGLEGRTMLMVLAPTKGAKKKA